MKNISQQLGEIEARLSAYERDPTECNHSVVAADAPDDIRWLITELRDARAKALELAQGICGIRVRMNDLAAERDRAVEQSERALALLEQDITVFKVDYMDMTDGCGIEDTRYFRKREDAERSAADHDLYGQPNAYLEEITVESSYVSKD